MARTTYGSDLTQDDLDFKSPGACNESRFPDDDLLRKHGFAIAMRAAGCEPRWKGPDRKLWTQTAALAWAAKQDA